MLEEIASWQNRQTGRLIDYEQVFVFEDDADVSRDVAFPPGWPMVGQDLAGCQHSIGIGNNLRVHLDLTGDDPLPPLLL